jgi:hypothetical protein
MYTCGWLGQPYVHLWVTWARSLASTRWVARGMFRVTLVQSSKEIESMAVDARGVGVD